jgi:hypothetical protein
MEPGSGPAQSPARPLNTLAGIGGSGHGLKVIMLPGDGSPGSISVTNDVPDRR